LFLACEELETLLANQEPIIKSLVAARDRLAPLDTTTVQVEAEDPEGEAIAISWRSEAGTLSSTSGARVVWTAPATAGKFRISVQVTDASNKKAESAVTITVVAAESPRVEITQPQDGAFIPGLGIITIQAVASHPNGIGRVEFWNRDKLLGIDNSPPYQVLWSVEGLSGPETILARAYRADNSGDPGEDAIRISIEGVTRL